MTYLSIALALVLVNIYGLPYYVLPIPERVRHPLHLWFKPSGYVGQTAGIFTLGLFLFMYIYPLRKRVRRLASLGSLVRWLEMHIIAGLVIPVVGAMHAGWRFKGLIGVGYVAMLMVSLSGVVGRYLYVHIPRGRSGLELSLEQIEEQRVALNGSIARSAGLEIHEVDRVLSAAIGSGGNGGILSSIRTMLDCDLTRWRVSRTIRRRWGASRRLDRSTLDEAVRLAGRQIALAQQRQMLAATGRIFRLWHTVHRPFSVTAFVAVFIHVVVVVFLGVTWFW